MVPDGGVSAPRPYRAFRDPSGDLSPRRRMRWERQRSLEGNLCMHAACLSFRLVEERICIRGSALSGCVTPQDLLSDPRIWPFAGSGP